MIKLNTHKRRNTKWIMLNMSVVADNAILFPWCSSLMTSSSTTWSKIIIFFWLTLIIYYGYVWGSVKHKDFFTQSSAYYIGNYFFWNLYAKSNKFCISLGNMCLKNMGRPSWREGSTVKGEVHNRNHMVKSGEHVH